MEPDFKTSAGTPLKLNAFAFVCSDESVNQTLASSERESQPGRKKGK